MNRRWQSDGIPLWRKLFSSNWWWYSEVHPDPLSLPPPENRPRFWRGEVRFIFALWLGIPLVSFFITELNARYWPFSQNTTYVGRLVEVRYRYPQFKIEMPDKKTLWLGFPMHEVLAMPDKGRPVDRWIPLVDRLDSRQYDCPGRWLAFDAEPAKVTFRPFLNIWEVHCASGPNLISTSTITEVWSDFSIWLYRTLFALSGSSLFLFCVLIINRERKRCGNNKG